MADSPHLSYPLRITPAGAVVVEDSTFGEYASIARYALRTPPGWRPEAPSFGMADATFLLRPDRAILAAVLGADPRIQALTEVERSALSGEIERVILEIQGA